VPDIKVSPLKTLLKLPGFMLWMSRHGPGRGRKWVTAAVEAYEKRPRPDLTRFSDKELSAKAVSHACTTWGRQRGTGYALGGMMFTSVLYDLCRRWFKDETGVNASRLLAGTGELQSANAGNRALAARPPLRRVPRREVRHLPAGDVVRTAWTLEETTAGRDFVASLESIHAPPTGTTPAVRWTCITRAGANSRTTCSTWSANYIRGEGKTDPEADLRHTRKNATTCGRSCSPSREVRSSVGCSATSCARPSSLPPSAKT